MARWLFALILGLAVAAPAHAFRCGTRLITKGDTRSEVQAICGEPAEIESRSVVLRRPFVWVHGKLHTVGDSFVEIPVDVWIYNLGPQKFMRRLRFEDGRLVHIETLGYGYHEQKPKPSR